MRGAQGMLRLGLALLLVGCCGSLALVASSSTPSYLAQDWSDADRQWFYTTAQGSRLVKYTWFLALERPSSQELFAADSLARFGYLPNARSAANRDGLPVGFVRDDGAEESWLGMTCAACHTGQLAYHGQTLQIDGAPTNGDLYAFLSEMSQALVETNRDGAKFARFAERVRAASSHPVTPTGLHGDLNRTAEAFTVFVRDSTPDHPWGPARADAFGMIFNRVSAIDLGIPANSRKPGAPVSYPFLWDTSLHDRVQWNGSAPNKTALERLGRNVGEALGVFARIKLTTPTWFHPYYESSVKRWNQIALDEKLSHLRSPRWPAAVFGPIDRIKAEQGKLVYSRVCVDCHEVVDRDGPNRHITVKMTPLSLVATDSTMATIALTRQADTGRLAGAKQPPLIGTTLQRNDLVFNLVGNAVVGAILSPVPGPLAGEAVRAVEAPRLRVPTPPNEYEALKAEIATGTALRPTRAGAPRGMATAVPVDNRLRKDLGVFTAERRSLAQAAYKARPLDGIWATAPYLHNGSVSSLYQLLLPESQRQRKFYVGSPEFDPVNVGFQSGPFEGGFELDTSLSGNHNTGHHYGTDLSDTERWQLVEYLKTL